MMDQLVQEEQKHIEDDGDMDEGVDMDNIDEADMEGDIQEEEDEVQEEAQFDFEQMDLRICGDLSKYQKISNQFIQSKKIKSLTNFSWPKALMAKSR